MLTISYLFLLFKALICRVHVRSAHPISSLSTKNFSVSIILSKAENVKESGSTAFQKALLWEVRVIYSFRGSNVYSPSKCPISNLHPPKIRERNAEKRNLVSLRQPPKDKHSACRRSTKRGQKKVSPSGGGVNLL
ncbi:hypothetical protein CEXT_295091 [Caerostris extrusa]|uniref:Secreted protein n=1 Tax=Caerostris extrusa TaxID=172846 RepID=A0AAV4RQB4_CAEEX|nr:hypothetical protein CEXT_295091 [Caerostris extrusa]